MKYLDEVLEGKENRDKTALIQEERKLSYQELDDYSGRLAKLLAAYGLQPGKRAVVWLEKSLEAVVSLLGVLRTGAAYVPIDYSLPLERFKFILQDCDPQVVITDLKGRAALHTLYGNSPLQTLVLEDFAKDLPDLPPTAREDKQDWRRENSFLRSEKDIAYIIYTSGSTGKPKGVMIRHDSVTAFIDSVLDLVDYNEKTRYLNVSPLHFDASVVDLYCTLKAGGSVVLMKPFVWPNELLCALDKYDITDTLMVSSILKLLVSRFANTSQYKLCHLKTIWYGAESCPVTVIRKVKERFPQVKFIHGYGPTEATHSTTLYIFDDIPEETAAFMPIGQPLPSISCYALNEENKVIGPGGVGELYIGGIQVMEGYCNDLEKTNAVLVPDIFNEEKKVYRSGDYVTIDTKGNYIYVGRKDDMIKSGGNLVYLSEIQKVLLSHHDIKDAIVLPLEDEIFNTRIKACIVIKPGRKLSEEELANYVEQQLPKYMVPNSFCFIDEGDIPRKPSGKVDRDALRKWKFV